jgi:uncharacterized protein YkwD
MSSHRRKRKASKAPNASKAGRAGAGRRKAVIAAAVVVAVGAVGTTAVLQAGGDGPGGWRDVASSWWGGQESGPAPDATPSSTPSERERTAVADAPATTAPSRTPSKRRSSPTPSASPSKKKTSPPAEKPADTVDKRAEPAKTPNPAKAESTPAPAATSADSGPTDRVLELVNAERAKAGCSPVTVDAKLTKAAQNHSQDMADHTNMSHTGSDGSSMTDRLARVGYAYRSAGENVAAGYGTAASVMDGWMNSPGHKANILNCGFKEIGIGLAGPGNYWTQNFGTPA